MIMKLGMHHQGLKLYKVYINDDPGLTMTHFMARSNWVAYIYIRIEKTVIKSLNEENLQQRTKLND